MYWTSSTPMISQMIKEWMHNFDRQLYCNLLLAASLPTNLVTIYWSANQESVSWQWMVHNGGRRRIKINGGQWLCVVWDIVSPAVQKTHVEGRRSGLSSWQAESSCQQTTDWRRWSFHYFWAAEEAQSARQLFCFCFLFKFHQSIKTGES